MIVFRVHTLYLLHLSLGKRHETLECIEGGIHVQLAGRGSTSASSSSRRLLAKMSDVVGGGAGRDDLRAGLRNRGGDAGGLRGADLGFRV